MIMPAIATYTPAEVRKLNKEERTILLYLIQSRSYPPGII